MSSEKNLAVFISGFGSNLNVIIENKAQLGHLFVVSSRADAYGITRAQDNQIPYLVLEKTIDWSALQQTLLEHKIQAIFLAGFMKILPTDFIDKWQGRIFNLHPSLLPKYKGLRAIEKAFEAHDDVGVSIHRVVPEVDAGQVVLQELALSADQVQTMSLEEVKEKVHAKEHALVQSWLDQWLESRI